MPTSHLPAKVSPVCDAPVVTASSRRDQDQVVQMIEIIAPERRQAFVIGLLGHGIMRTHWWMHLAIRAGMLRNRVDRTTLWSAWFRTARAKGYGEYADSLINNVIEAFVHHMRSGFDRESTLSIGGLSPREMQAVANLIAVCCRYEPPKVQTLVAAATNTRYGAVV